MMNLKKLALNVDDDLNQIIICNPTTVIYKKVNNNYQYYVDSSETLLHLLKKKGYEIEESKDEFITNYDVGGNFCFDRILRYNKQIELNWEILIGLLKDDGDTIRIDLKPDKLSDRQSQIVNMLNCKPLYCPNADLSEGYPENLIRVSIKTSSENLAQLVRNHLGLIQNNHNKYRELGNYYAQKNCTFNIMPTFKSIAGTPYASLNSLFEENNDLSIIKQQTKIVLGRDNKNEEVGLVPNDLLLHMAVFGASGSGKSSILFNLVNQIWSKYPLLIIDPKGEFKNMKQRYRNFKVYDPTLYYPINIFRIPQADTLEKYIALLKEILNILLCLHDLPAIQDLVEKAIRITYEKFGYSLSSTYDQGTPFKMSDFSLVLHDCILKSKYAPNEKSNVFQIITSRLNRCLQMEHVFGCGESINFHEILNRENVIIDLAQTPPEMRSLLMKITVILATYEIKKNGSCSNQLKNVIIVDEAHVLFGNNDKYFDCEFVNDVHEMRSRGTSLIMVDQRMKKLESSLLDCFTYQINGRLLPCDRELFFNNERYDLTKAKIMGSLPTGVFAFQAKGTTLRNMTPILNPLVINTENVIDYYLERNKEVEYEKKNTSYKKCNTCKLKDTCKLQKTMEIIADNIKNKVNYTQLDKKEKIHVIQNELNKVNLNCNFKEAINCINYIIMSNK